MASRLDGNAAKRVVTSEPPPWRVWRERARWRRAVRWMETYCVLPKGFGAGKRLVLAKDQKEWLKVVLAPGITSAARSLPRGNGKSTFMAAFGLWALFDEDESGAPQVRVVA